MLTTAALILCSIIFVRMFTYRREGARFRRGVSILAYIVMVCCGATVIYITSGKLHISYYHWPMVVLLGVFAVATISCGGNLAQVLRNGDRWDGRDRRKVG
ncbi:MAG: phage holin family protein [Pseudomonadaceae bacterium]|jgi:peptidoglycan/LPS O-acetylase OafA/YrhL|uniref:phage holin family protein n=1 Tax=Pseudomonas sp. TaxID=306 RepID=UPI000854E946|nr:MULTISPECIES: phage holin family protein [Pseudomonas]MBQ53485.1 phage holin family protein [Pseudomonadaceae bacterium]OEO24056.1 hypothetical protein AX279_19685 [Pseudomonas sp. J237]HCP54581.1 phage holin family protein [Pseudomonas sp.]|tara:strand:- start:581 stop:883 length:303 start_codon:yes stop_codon:yes gene_type:complete